MRQLTLFDAEEKTRTFWVMSKRGVSLAAAITIELLNELSAPSFAVIVKRKMGLKGDTVPDALAREFADASDAVFEERLQIKELVEDKSTYRLVVVDDSGQPAIRGNRPAGFAMRESEAGSLDEMAQTAMTVRKLETIAQRRVEMKRLDPDAAARALGTVHALLD